MSDTKKLSLLVRIGQKDHTLIKTRGALFWTYYPGESLPPCRGLWGTLHTGDDIDCNYCLLWEC